MDSCPIKNVSVLISKTLGSVLNLKKKKKFLEIHLLILIQHPCSYLHYQNTEPLNIKKPEPNDGLDELVNPSYPILLINPEFTPISIPPPI